MSTALALEVGLIAPLVGLVLAVAATWIVTVHAPVDDEEKRSPRLAIVFPAGALVGAATLAGLDALLTWIFGGPIGVAAAAGAVAGAVATPLMLAGLLVGFSTTVSVLLPFAANTGALLLAPAAL